VVLTYLPQGDEIVKQANQASSDATDSQSNGPKVRLGLAAGGAEEPVEVIDVASVETQEVPDQEVPDTDKVVLVALELKRQSRAKAPYEVIERLPINTQDMAGARQVLEYLRLQSTEVQLSSEWYSQKYWYTNPPVVPTGDPADLAPVTGMFPHHHR